jgi:hypothetical protein
LMLMESRSAASSGVKSGSLGKGRSVISRIHKV